MRRFSALAAAAVAAFTVTNASAVLITIDDFNSPDMVVIDQLGGGATVVNSPGNVPLNRYVSHELLTGTNDANGGGSSVKIGSQTFPPGALEIANASGRDSEVKIGWTLPAGLVLDSTAGPAAFLFSILQSDGNPTSVQLLFNNVSVGSYSIPGNTNNLPLSFAVNAATQNLMSAGGSLVLVINGATGWDMSLDSFGVNIPEPATMALVGLALLGAGVASRRRQA